jgi:HK97 family phage major capsid protein
LHQVLELVGRMNGDRLMKAAVDVGTTTDSDFAAPLVNYTVMANEFIEFLRPQTIIGRIPGLRMVPFNIRIPRQTAGATAQWVGEGRPKPVGKQSFDYVTLAYMKLAIITAITEELARFSQPNAETLIRDDLAKAVIQQMDNDFIEPDNAGTANIKPASITYGITPIQSTGSTEAAITADVKAVFKAFTDANLDPSDAVWLMHTQTALGLSMVRNALGQRPIGFEGIGINGGTFFGLPVVASTNPGFTPDGSPTEKVLALVKASDILLADDGQVTIDTSREASIQMDSAPTYPADATTVLTSLWQHNLLGIKAERYITWVRARDSSVVLLENVGWGG